MAMSKPHSRSVSRATSGDRPVGTMFARSQASISPPMRSNSSPDSGDSTNTTSAPALGGAAFFRHLLILDLDGLRPRRLVPAHRVADVDEPAEPGVRIRDERLAGTLRDLPHPPDHVGVGRDAGVGHA